MTLRMFSTLAVAAALERDVLPRLAREGREIDVTFDPTAVLRQRVADGEPFDLVFAIEDWVRELAAHGRLDPETVRHVGSVGIGVAVAPDAPVAPVGSPDAVRALVTSARSVAWSRSGASGKAFLRVLDELGVRAEVESKATILEKGFTAEAILDGRADVAVQQVSELHYVPGIQVLGALPAELQSTTSFAVGAQLATGQTMDALDRLTNTDARAGYRSTGLF
ncbi:molybdate ABC transporter substrate-binding protein [Sciscionella sediminilitoris]|uniref:molybdate ABC transporter substrate-binding protein n=1 Tax=Sciscionella sediminilitoris TaxID=1445613 RepID=UPI000565FEE1|nr:substrate-binding domain-containing protein [Sciscionella sp. SE31]